MTYLVTNVLYEYLVGLYILGLSKYTLFLNNVHFDRWEVEKNSLRKFPL